MTLVAKLLLGIVLIGTLGSGVWVLYTQSTSNQQSANTTSVGEMSTTTVTMNTSTATTTTNREAYVPIPRTPVPDPSPTSPHELSITSIAPASGPSGTFVTIAGSGFDSTSQVIIGNGGISMVRVNTAGTLLTFTMPSSLGAYCLPGHPCPMYELLLKPGTYSLNVRNVDGINSNLVSFTLTDTTAP